MNGFLKKLQKSAFQKSRPSFATILSANKVNVDRLEKILISAMKQSNQCYLPKLNEPIAIKDFLKLKCSGQLFIAHCEETQKQSLKTVLKPNADVTMLIGPEGDFSEKEIALAIQSHYVPVMLGETRLRTETAAIVACHTVVFTNE